MPTDTELPGNTKLKTFISSGGESAAYEEAYDPLRFDQYPWMGFVAFMCLYVGSVIVDKVMRKISPKLYHKEMSHSKQRIVVTYVAEIVLTTIAFGYNISCGIPALTGDMENMTLDQFKHFRYTGTMVTLIYIWELIYRQEMGAPLLLHHILTVVLIQAFVLDIVQDLDLVRLRQVIFLLLTATSEQTSFIALLLHRFKKYLWAGRFFYIATVSSFVIKSMVFFFGLYLFATSDYIKEHDAPNDTFWTWGWVPITTALFASQISACHIMMTLGRRSFYALKHGDDAAASAYAPSVRSAPSADSRMSLIEAAHLTSSRSWASFGFGKPAKKPSTSGASEHRIDIPKSDDDDALRQVRSVSGDLTFPRCEQTPRGSTSGAHEQRSAQSSVEPTVFVGPLIET